METRTTTTATAATPPATAPPPAASPPAAAPAAKQLPAAPDESAKKRSTVLRMGLLSAVAGVAVLAMGGPGATIGALFSAIAMEVVVDAATEAIKASVEG